MLKIPSSYDATGIRKEQVFSTESASTAYPLAGTASMDPFIRRMDVSLGLSATRSNLQLIPTDLVGGNIEVGKRTKVTVDRSRGNG